TASVIGKSFPQSILEKVAALSGFELAARLSVLRQRQFLSEQALFPEAQYAFKHPLTQEVAYKSQLSERRRRTHAAVARAIEELRADRLNEEAGVLAYHWEEAGDALQAARWHRRSARWTEDTDPSESLRHWNKVRDLLPGAVESAEKMSLRLEAC